MAASEDMGARRDALDAATVHCWANQHFKVWRIKTLRIYHDRVMEVVDRFKSVFKDADDV